ncbi:unnamed protein product [Pieris brassicae]|uniref:Uncharacterized protein n=1 Tax=Pieris brassicae TaxID=7116 RepID=A0A9P0XCX9_PIEBR|nr:unnamed protein product [Pieris brassicae]
MLDQMISASVPSLHSSICISLRAPDFMSFSLSSETIQYDPEFMQFEFKHEVFESSLAIKVVCESGVILSPTARYCAAKLELNMGRGNGLADEARHLQQSEPPDAPLMANGDVVTCNAIRVHTARYYISRFLL